MTAITDECRFTNPITSHANLTNLYIRNCIPGASKAPTGAAASRRPTSAGNRPANGRSAARDDSASAFDAETAPERRGAGKNNGRGGNRSRGAPGERPRKREHDRHDASGRGHETEKRHGQGRGNWGAEGDEVKDLEEKLNIADEEGGEGDAPAEEEEKQMSLEEYEAMLAEKRAALNTQREAAKIDDAQLSGLKAFEKPEEEDIFGSVAGGKTKAVREKERKERETIDVGFRIQSADEVRGGRSGGRGGDRRGGGRGGDRRGSRGGGGAGAARGNQRGGGRGGRGANINVNDTSAFPTLG